MSPPVTSSAPCANRLLAALPAAEYQRLLPHLEYVEHAFGEVIYEPDKPMAYSYFPLSSVIALQYTTKDGATTEMGLVGRDGMGGITIFTGGGTMPNTTVVQIAGGAYRMKAKALQAEFMQGGGLQQLLLRFMQALITQISHAAVCNSLHPTEQRLCRWLLLLHDRVQVDELCLTQELISRTIGVRRESINAAAGHLQTRGVIGFSRGRIKIRDRQGLEACACECYEVIRQEYARLLG